MYRIIESKLKIKSKDNKVKKASITYNCSDNDCETFFLITVHYGN